ncbi:MULTISPECIES: zinc-binding dehydrogenase [Rhodococcus]|uniref:Alcohol dehydrogenase n=1 Tax=Rhodococcus aetherivorans TaxID=191292 RepID=A0A059MV80_9NOCA|nr:MULTISPECIES: zinc-binding dehydrogenase [Rhodococcus]ETT26064.1 Alcohol dehydrogenase GroES domain protein [Rhodococcus rhodochrous ATCC 21198]AKE88853.1 zinc-binding dehydrogenase [Rhodococcus aetherivorans]ANZ26461.1 zinc-binding dehydrogenase [Rhodococcus sp. WB1]KDE15048.1 zinc-binding dehydrogenase [Rhodococcus aetherivorans]MBC2591470.1 alcohol dehydrogenase catalytic domain-containing protein [Rhodococcus aetherivorans]
MTETMRAARFHADTRTNVLEDVPIPSPGPGEVLVKVAFCGICHSDLSLLDGTFPALLPVVTQGHEAAGIIAAVGDGVTGWEVGDRVVPSAGRPCMQCRKCRRGDLTNCLNIQLMAFAYDGAWAEYTVAQAGGLTLVPDNVPLEQAAILADAVSTPFGAVVRTGQVQVGEAVGVWGVGGVGTHIVQLARLIGAVPVLAFDINPAVRERALELGADYAFDSRDPDLVQRVAEATGGKMLDVAFDSAGVKATFDQALQCVMTGGRVVVVGLSGQEASLGPTATFGLSRKHVMGHLGYKNVDIETLAALVSRGRLDISRSISEIVPLENIAEGIEKLHNHIGDPIRILVQP